MRQIVQLGGALAFICLAACGGEDELNELDVLREDPHKPCLSCHSEGGSVSYIPWTVEGSAFADATSLTPAKGIWVVLDDAKGHREIMGVNPAGLFHTNKPVTPPFDISIHKDVGNKQYKVVKKIKTHSGDCNTCHRPGGAALQIHEPPG